MGGREQSAAMLQALDRSRPDGAASWTLPEWGHALSAGIFPFCARYDERLFPIGSAFTISKLGIIASAYHNVHDSLRRHPRGEQLRRHPLHTGVDLGDFGFSVIHRHVTDGSTHHVSSWPIENVHGALPTDVIFGNTTFQQAFPYAALPVSFVTPRIGSRVSILGYGGLRNAEAGLSLRALAEGDLAEMLDAGLMLHVHEGHVTRVFSQRFASGFIEGPCFTVDCEIPHGVSGGPVVNDAGYVCGIASAGASIYFDSPATIVSLLSPTITTQIRVVARLGPVTIEGNPYVLDLVKNGSIQSDGTEDQICVTLTAEGLRVDVATFRDDRAFVHEHFQGYQQRRPAVPRTEP